MTQTRKREDLLTHQHAGASEETVRCFSKRIHSCPPHAQRAWAHATGKRYLQTDDTQYGAIGLRRRAASKPMAVTTQLSSPIGCRMAAAREPLGSSCNRDSIGGACSDDANAEKRRPTGPPVP
mmetsp:Transcript_15463/g.25835  ORF Transcript_15463/g.25835 Transcript_15463/m.25835 type:complete len:123 (-) Transcript_15463:1432-1800(-)